MIAVARDMLIAAAALGAWIGSLYAWPFGPCGRCKGTGRNRGSNARRFGTCRRCDGRGRVQRLGSRTVHRAAWRVRGEVLRELERRRDRKAADRSEHPRKLNSRDR
jgi:hypothetical protein